MTTSSRPLARCKPHGLAYDPAIHDGCTLCRSSARPRPGDSSTNRVLARVAMILVMMLWVGGILGGAYVGYHRAQGRVAGLSSAKAELAPMPALPPVAPLGPEENEKLPSELPMLGRTGVDEYGYPLDQVDERGLRLLLFTGNFPRLTGYVEQLQAAFESDFHKEDWMTQVADAFEDADPAVGARIDDWCRASPASFAPLLARAKHRYALGWYYRGGKFANETAKDRLAKHGDLLESAQSDLAQALALKPKLVVAQQTQLWILTSISNSKSEGKRKLLDAALATCPDCFRIRSKYLSSLVPRWGGSFPEMEAFAVEAQAGVARNPRLKVLLGYADDERCNVYREASKLTAALEACDHALLVAKDHRFLSTRATALKAADRYPDALLAMDQALSLLPQDVGDLAERAELRLHQGLLKEGTEDLRAAKRLQRVSSTVTQAVDYAVGTLILAGYQRGTAKDDAGAIEAFDLALSLSPNNEDALQRKAFAEHRLAGSDETVRLEALARANATDFDVYKKLDDELVKTREFPRIVEHWNRYIAAKPDDARAYLERGGALLHAGSITSAIQDLDRACAGGLERGCQGARFARSKVQ